MIAITAVHRRLAELADKAKRLGGYANLSEAEQVELSHCLHANANLVYRYDVLTTLSWIAHEVNDVEWQHDICRQIDELESKMK
jgi:hypothetical protein